MKGAPYSKGMMIVLLGPDGSGKTTIKSSLEESLNTIFTSINHFYFRPELLPFPGVLVGLREDIRTGANPNPHGHKRENPIKSIIRFVYYLVDFILGYWIKIHPLKKRGCLIIFDRYYYDYFVDLFRYNMSIPSWFPRFFLPLIPSPDMTFYLHASVETLYRRKQEIPLTELNRQINVLDELVKSLPNAYKVSTERTIKEITEEIIDIIKNARSSNG